MPPRHLQIVSWVQNAHDHIFQTFGVVRRRANGHLSQFVTGKTIRFLQFGLYKTGIILGITPAPGNELFWGFIKAPLRCRRR